MEVAVSHSGVVDVLFEDLASNSLYVYINTRLMEGPPNATYLAPHHS